MRIMNISRMRRAALGAVGAGALVVTAACSTNDDMRVRAHPLPPAARGAYPDPATVDAAVECVNTLDWLEVA